MSVGFVTDEGDTELGVAYLHQQDRHKFVRTCSIWRALDVIGDVPTLLILEAIWLQERRFDKILKRTSLTKTLISNRLSKLVDTGILRTHPYSRRPLRYEYQLTSKGADLYGVTLMLHCWERKWSVEARNFELSLVHRDCEGDADPQPVCTHCQQVIKAEDVSWEAGPGAGLMLPNYERRRQYRNRGQSIENHALFTESAEVLGDRWSSLIIRSILTRLHRFDQILEDTAIASNILTDRLAWLVESGLISAATYGRATDRYAYQLTDKGLEFFPVLMMLQFWGDKYCAAPEGPPVILRHALCGGVLSPAVGCGTCGELLKVGDTKLVMKDV